MQNLGSSSSSSSLFPISDSTADELYGKRYFTTDALQIKHWLTVLQGSSPGETILIHRIDAAEVEDYQSTQLSSSTSPAITAAVTAVTGLEENSPDSAVMLTIPPDGESLEDTPPPSAEPIPTDVSFSIPDGN